MDSNLANKISQASQWINSDAYNNSQSGVSLNSNNLSDSKDTKALNAYASVTNTISDTISDAYVGTGNTLSDLVWNWSGTSVLPGTASWAGTSADNLLNIPENKTDSILKDLKIEIEDKLEECDRRIDDIFNQMKEDRSKTTLMGPVFQYHVGMRLAYETVLNKIKKYLEDNNDNKEN